MGRSKRNAGSDDHGAQRIIINLEADELEMPVDKFWAWMPKQKKPGTGLLQFPVLAKFCQSLCVLLHGSVD